MDRHFIERGKEKATLSSGYGRDRKIMCKLAEVKAVIFPWYKCCLEFSL